MIGLFLSSLIAGRIGDIIGRKPTLMLMVLVACIGSTCGAFCYDYWSFAATRFVTALGKSRNLSNGQTITDIF